MLKTNIRREEEQFKAELNRRDEQIASMSAGALSNLAGRHAELARRRANAIEVIWKSTVGLRRFKLASDMSQSINWSIAIKASENGSPDSAKTRQFAQTIWDSCKLEEALAVNDQTADYERPFLPALTWALFSAYRQVLLYPVVQISIARLGVGPKMLRNPDAMITLVKTVLPHQSAFVDEQRDLSFPFLVNELEEVLFNSLRNALQIDGGDEETVKRAADIIAAVHKVELELDNKNKSDILN